MRRTDQPNIFVLIVHVNPKARFPTAEDCVSFFAFLDYKSCLRCCSLVNPCSCPTAWNYNRILARSCTLVVAQIGHLGKEGRHEYF